jgi:hypothetical protein
MRRNVAGQCHHGAGICYVIEMLSRQVRAHHLRAYVGGVRSTSTPSQQLFQLGSVKKQPRTSAYRSALEVAVEAAVGQVRPGHDPLQRDVVKTGAVEQPAGAFDDFLFYFGTMS